jgi:glutamate formiminotransferase
MAWIECVPNLSEGRRPEIVDACAHAVEGSGAALLDRSMDASHNRSVLTFAGDSTTLTAAVLALFDRAVASVDLRHHSGQHPRIGAVDVVPFVPLGATPMADCIALARAVGRTVADRFGLPVFLYEEASSSPERRALEDLRRGGLTGLGARIGQPGWAPDYGPARLHPSAGASVIGARRPLIAYNVNLDTVVLDVARQIAVSVRQSSGGLPSLKAIAVDLPDRGIVQVSMNLTDFARTSIVQAFDAVAREARRHGVAIADSELVGLAPEAALSASIAAAVRLRDFSNDMILEHRLRAAGIPL